MRPVFDILVECGLYVARCNACAMQCQRNGRTMHEAVNALPCRSITTIDKVVAGIFQKEDK